MEALQYCNWLELLSSVKPDEFGELEIGTGNQSPGRKSVAMKIGGDTEWRSRGMRSSNGKRSEAIRIDQK